jgi:molybdate transport system substrate-binding protein
MTRSPLVPWVALATVLAFSMGAASAGAADIRVYSGGAPQGVVRGLAPEFEKATGHRVELTFALVTAIQKKLAAGEKADVILLPVPLIAATEQTVPLRSEGRVALVRVGIGVIARQGAAPPDISTADAVRRMLLEARAVALPDPGTPTGSHLARVMAQLGIADAIRPKAISKGAINGGGELVAQGEADVGLYLVSEVRAIKGVSVVGLLPEALQSFVVYGAAVPATNAAPEAALAFIKFLSEPARGERWKAAGFELLGSAD